MTRARDVFPRLAGRSQGLLLGTALMSAVMGAAVVSVMDGPPASNVTAVNAAVTGNTRQDTPDPSRSHAPAAAQPAQEVPATTTTSPTTAKPTTTTTVATRSSTTQPARPSTTRVPSTTAAPTTTTPTTEAPVAPTETPPPVVPAS